MFVVFLNFLWFHVVLCGQMNSGHTKQNLHLKTVSTLARIENQSLLHCTHSLLRPHTIIVSLHGVFKD